MTVGLLAARSHYAL